MILLLEKSLIVLDAVAWNLIRNIQIYRLTFGLLVHLML